MLPVGAAALYELLRLLLKIRSQEQGVIPRLIASDDDLKRLAVFSDRKNPVLRGWRFEIFGRDAVALREGKLSISYDAEHHRIGNWRKSRELTPALFCLFVRLIIQTVQQL